MDTRGEYEAETYIRDPLYDEIGLSELEVTVLDDPRVQRLRHIKQLGVTNRVYPSATHTRFSHSLGVMHLSGRMANTLGLSDEKVTATRIAGLLHDVGHGPFSHTSEEMGDGEFDHEKRSCEIAEDICSEISVDAEYVMDQIQGNATPSIVAGVIDSDRLDYIIRDSQYSAVNHGMVDINSILRFCQSIDNSIAFNHKAVPSINDLLSARLRMRNTVYRYPTVRHFGTLMKRAMEEYSQSISTEITTLDDHQMHTELINNENEFYSQIQSRDLKHDRFKFGTDIFSRTRLEELSRISDRQIRTHICSETELTESDVLVSSPYIPKNLSKNTTIVTEKNEKATLREYSRYPKYIYDEAWESTNIVVYINQNQREFTDRQIRKLLLEIR